MDPGSRVTSGMTKNHKSKKLIPVPETSCTLLGMDHWTLAIEKNTKALTQIVAGLFVMCGLCSSPGHPPRRPSVDGAFGLSADQRFTNCAALSRKAGLATEGECPNQDGKFTIRLTPVTRRILTRVLRTTEAALRRLIVLYVNVHGIKVKSPKPSNRPLPDFASFGSGTRKRTPVFQLFDPRKSLVMLNGKEVDFSSASLALDATEGGCQDQTGPVGLAGVPRAHFIGSPDWYSTPSVCSICGGKKGTGFDQSLRGSRSKCDQHLCHCASARSLESEQETNNSAEKYLRRLQALNHALKTIPKQARRLARMMAARKNAPAGIKCIAPIRPGIPPGYAKHSKTPEHETLRECHGILRDWESNPPEK